MNCFKGFDSVLLVLCVGQVELSKVDTQNTTEKISEQDFKPQIVIQTVKAQACPKFTYAPHCSADQHSAG